MEPFIADFLLNKKIPRILRYTVLAVLVGFIVFVCAYAGIVSKYLTGKMICCVIAVLMLIMGCLAAKKIYKKGK